MFSDLECDYINPIDLCNKLNQVCNGFMLDLSRVAHIRCPVCASRAHLAQLLGDVESGETIVIIRHGRAVARLAPEATRRQADVR